MAKKPSIEMEVTMQAAIAKWGNSLAVRLPAQVAREINVIDGSQVDLTIQDGTVMIRAARPRYKLSELLAGMEPMDSVEDVDFGSPQGEEVW
jgi:antitoxin MazE